MDAQRFVVTGRVQGVGFRAFVLRVARELGVGGEVWNTDRGSVEMEVFHDDDSQLDKFRERLRVGPGQVRRVLAEPGGLDQWSAMRIGPDRP